MDFKTRYPDFAAVEEHIRRARAERSVAIAYALANGWEKAERGLVRMAKALSSALAAERDKRGVKSGAFVKRLVPKG